MDALRPEAKADRDAEIDEILRAIGDEFFEREIPERLLRALRAAAAAKEARSKDQADSPRNSGEKRSARTRDT